MSVDECLALSVKGEFFSPLLPHTGNRFSLQKQEGLN